MPYDSGKVSQFPEKPRSSHAPSEDATGYIKSSQKVGFGHNEHDGRMPHPFKEVPPNDESGEGRNE